MSSLKDTGQRTVFDTGSSKEIVEGRGKYNLLPHRALSDVLEIGRRQIYLKDKPNLFSYIMGEIGKVYRYDVVDLKIHSLAKIAKSFILEKYETEFEAIKALAILYEKGASKYEARDWEKGRPMEVFIDSALRHLTQHLNGEIDEDHKTAFLWNIVSCIETLYRFPELAVTIP